MRLFSYNDRDRQSGQVEAAAHKPLGQCPKQGVHQQGEQEDDADGKAYAVLQFDYAADVIEGLIYFIGKIGKNNGADKDQHLSDKANYKVANDADGQPMLGKHPRIGAGQVSVQLGTGNQRKDQEEE